MNLNQSLHHRAVRAGHASSLLLTTLTMVCVTFADITQAATHVWTGASKAGPYLSEPDNWINGSVPTANEANVILEFPATDNSQQPIFDIPNLKVDRINIKSGYTFYGLPGGSKVSLRGTTDAIQAFTGSTFHTSLEIELLNPNVEFEVAFNFTLAIHGRLSGVGGFRKTGLGTLEIGGALSNTYDADTTVNTGQLRLNKLLGIAIPGNLVIGDGVGNPDADVVRLLNDQQIVDTATVTIKSTGLLALNNRDETLGPILFEGGHLTTGAGVLTLNGNVTSLASPQSAQMEGSVNLGSRSRFFTVADGGVDEDLIVSAAIAGPLTVGFGKQGPGRLVLSGNNTHTGPNNISQGVVEMRHSKAFGATNAPTTVLQGASLWLNQIESPEETLILNGNGGDYGGTLRVLAEPGAGWNGPVSLQSDVLIDVAESCDLYLRHAISGTGGFTKTGLGQLLLTGSAANTYAGTTTVEGGSLTLSKIAGIAAIPAPLVIGHPSVSAFPRDTVKIQTPNQIANTATISIHRTGILDLQNVQESVGPLDFSGGEVRLQFSTLTLLGNVHCSASLLDLAFITGDTGILALGSQSRTFDVEAGSALRITSPISGGAGVGIIKQGLGNLELYGANTYQGLTSIQKGRVAVVGPKGTLGSSTLGTLVGSEGRLLSSWVDLGVEPLVFNGDPTDNSGPVFSIHGECSHSGLITFFSGKTNTFEVQTVRFTQTGAITGAGALRKTGPSPMEMAGNLPNGFDGGLSVDDGVMVLNKGNNSIAVPGALRIGSAQGAANSRVVQLLQANQIADNAPVIVGSSGMLNLNNLPETIGSLEGSGLVNTLFSTLTTGANNQSTEFSGQLGGAGFTTLVKIGDGTLTLSGAHSYLGKTLVTDGRLLVEGQITGAVWVSDKAILGGSGSVGNLAVTNGFVSPGSSPGILTSKNASLNTTSELTVELHGPNAGSGYDQLNIQGTVTLGNPILKVSLQYPSLPGTEYVILKNDNADPILGTFLGLPEGKTFKVNGASFTISYLGGDGNDVVIKHINTPPTLVNLNVPGQAKEGNTVTFKATLQDPDPGDSFKFLIKWGDGSDPVTLDLPPGTTEIEVSHVYADDNPTVTISDPYLYDYALYDKTGVGSFGNGIIIVSNVKPTLTLPATVQGTAGKPITISGQIADPGTDTFKVVWQFLDGSSVESVVVGTNRTFSLTHTTNLPGTYGANIALIDDDGEVDTVTIQIVVAADSTPPLLTLQKSEEAGQAILSWPVGSSDDLWALESTSNLPDGPWQTVNASPVENNGKWVVTLNINPDQGAEFFRLRKP